VQLSMQGGVGVVTGAGSGLGRAICMRLAQEQAVVAAVDINGEGATQTAKDITAAGGKAAAFRCDISDQAQVSATIAAIQSSLGAPRWLFNAAGIVSHGRVEHISYETFSKVLAINVGGAFLMSKAVLPSLVQNQGSIVNVASLAGTMGVPYMVSYSTSKGALIAMTRAMAKEYVDRKVRINVLAPGGIDTPMYEVPFPPDANPEILATLPRTSMALAKPDELANMAVFIASPEGGNISGAVVPVDGAST
jgi:NAD(P)-dependent dehydrogenase (short-subunit alcohol dehydrogenase family)